MAGMEGGENRRQQEKILVRDSFFVNCATFFGQIRHAVLAGGGNLETKKIGNDSQNVPNMYITNRQYLPTF